MANMHVVIPIVEGMMLHPHLHDILLNYLI